MFYIPGIFLFPLKIFVSIFQVFCIFLYFVKTVLKYNIGKSLYFTFVSVNKLIRIKLTEQFYEIT